MTRTFVAVLSYLAVSLPAAQAAFGTYYSLVFPQPYATFYKKASITFKVPKAPSPQENFLYLWPGLDVGSPLFQPVVADFSTPKSFGCNAAAGQWCLWPYIYGSNPDKQGPFVPVSAGDVLDMVIEYNGNNNGYTQTTTRGGTVIGKLSGGAGEGLPHRFQTAVECSANATGNSVAHTYTNLVLTLGKADANFKNYVQKTLNHVTTSGLYTKDNGATWRVDTINMLSSVCDPSDDNKSAQAQTQAIDAPDRVMPTPDDTDAAPVGN